MNTIMKSARKLCSDDYRSELKNLGVLSPTRNVHPLSPPLSGIEYEAMERDRAKYFLYYHAIVMAVNDFKVKHAKMPQKKLECMVLGAGRGRLVDYCVDAFQEANVNGIVHVIEINDYANGFLRERYASNAAVKVHKPIVIREAAEVRQAVQKELIDHDLAVLTVSKPIELIVSELFGSFGDNEFVSEILTAAVKLFGNRDQNNVLNCISIPQSYTTYMGAVWSPTLNEYFSEKPVHLSVLGIPTDALLVSRLHEVYSCDCVAQQEKLSSNFKLESGDKLHTVSGFAGYFRAQLYKDIYIDTRIGDTRNTYFWEAAFFPTPHLIQRPQISSQEIKVSRKCIRTKNDELLSLSHPVYEMWYEWEITYSDDTNTTHIDVYNKNGEYHKLHI